VILLLQQPLNFTTLICAVIEYENGKDNPTHYLVQLINLEDPNDQ